MRIGLFDSGLGGLCVLKKLIEIHPCNEYIYFGDTANLPYGNKNKEELFNLSTKIVEFLNSIKVDLIIVACGTCSATVLKDLKDKFQVPIISVLEPTIDYLKDNYQKIGVIGTKATIRSKYFENNLSGLSVTTLETPALVPMIENNLIDTAEFKDVLKNYLDYFNDIEVLVLGCTHYPLIKNEILEVVDLPLIDMGEILSEAIEINDETELKLTICFSALNENLIKNVNEMFGECKILERKL